MTNEADRAQFEKELQKEFIAQDKILAWENWLIEKLWQTRTPVMTNEAEERARYLLREALACAVRLAFARHNLELDPDAATEEEIAYDAAGACFGEECCDDKPIAEVTELIALAARAASPVSAPTKRMMVTSGGWIHEECPDCRGVCSPVIVHPDECAKYDDGARAVAPVSAEQPTPCTCCNDLAQIAAEFADASRADNEEEQLRHRQRYMGMLSRHITTGHVAAPSVASEDSATQPVPAANNWGIDGHKTTCAFVRYADSCTCGWLAEIERRSLSKQPGSEDWMRKAAALEAILCRVRKIAIERLSLGDRNAILTAADSSAASQLSTEKK